VLILKNLFKKGKSNQELPGIDRQTFKVILNKDWDPKQITLTKPVEKIYSEEDMKQFGLYLGDNFKKLKGKTIDEIFKQFLNK